jgi:hypothetical protein
VFPKKEFFQKIRTNQKKINKNFLFWKVFLKKENSKKGKKFPHSERKFPRLKTKFPKMEKYSHA